MTYDPRACGALCDRCMLRTMRQGEPVGPEAKVDARMVVVGDNPSPEDVTEGRPLTGRSGMEVTQALQALGVPREQTSYHLALACRSTDGRLTSVRAATAKENRRRAKEARKLREDHKRQVKAAKAAGVDAPPFALPADLEPMLDPLTACAPRLYRELAGVRDLVTVGKEPWTALTGSEHAIKAVQATMWTGTCRDGVDRRIVPAVHPAMLQREQRWRLPFRRTFARAFAWFRGALAWTEPTIVEKPSLAYWREHALPYFKSAPWITYDTETDGLEPWRANLRTVQVATSDYAVVIPFLSVAAAWSRRVLLKEHGVKRWKVIEAAWHEAGRTGLGSVDGLDADVADTLDRYFRRDFTFYPDDEARAFAEDVVDLLATHPHVFGHNAGSYDRPVLEQLARRAGRPGFTPNLDTDTVLLHRYTDPDLPHGLDFVGSYFTDVHAWKADKPGEHAKSDAQLWRYGGLDAVVNARLLPPLLEQARERWQRVQRASRELRPVGMPVPAVSGLRTPTVSTVADPVLRQDHNMQAVCYEMHAIGIRVDQQRRLEHEAIHRYDEALWTIRLARTLWETGARDLCENVQPPSEGDLPPTVRVPMGVTRSGRPRHVTMQIGWKHKDGRVALTPGAPEREGWTRFAAPVDRGEDVAAVLERVAFNPRSGDHVRGLLFDRWDLPFPDMVPAKQLRTQSGDRSVADVILRAYMADKSLHEDQRRILHCLRRSKRMRTFYGRFLSRLVPPDLAGDVDWLTVWEDGRLRVSWNAHGTGVGRLSSGGRPSRINLQTFPEKLRDVFVPEEGHTFVGADLAAIHMVIIANLWNIPSLQAEYAKGKDADPHASLARICFGRDFDTADGHPCEANGMSWKGQAKKLRQTAKGLRYAGAYGAAIPTIHATMTRTEDEDGNLVNADLDYDFVRAAYSTWMGQEPEWERAWDREIRLYRQHRYMLSPVLGRRADFADGEDRNQIVNYRVLSGEADIMGPATVRVRNRCGWGAWGPNTGIVLQAHDSIVLEVPEDRAVEGLRILEDEMNVRVPGWPVPVTSDGKIAGFKQDDTGRWASTGVRRHLGQV